MKYDIFISYRREGGDTLAQLIYDRLVSRGYQVFLDIESLRSGKFNEKLLEVIEECNDIILILPPNALERCSNPGDWVYEEVSHALKHKKNIVPVMLQGFDWPEVMPEGLEELPNFNGIRDSKEYFDAVIQKLTGLLKSKPVLFGNLRTKMEEKKKKFSLGSWIRGHKKAVAALSAILAILAAAGIWIFGFGGLQKEEVKQIRILLEPTDDTSVSDYQDSLTLLKQRFDVLVKGHEKDSEWMEKGDSVEFAFPWSLVPDGDAEWLIRAWISRPIELFLYAGDERLASREDAETYLSLNREDLAEITYEKGQPEALDPVAEGVETDGDYYYIKVSLTENAMKRVKETLGDSRYYYLAQDMLDYQEQFFYNTLTLGEDGVFYTTDDWQLEHLFALTVHDWKSEPLPGRFYFQVQYPADWESVDEEIVAGANQVNYEDMTGDLATFHFTTTSDVTEGEFIDVQKALKQRLDTLQMPYALGHSVTSPYDFAIRMGTEHLSLDLVNMLLDSLYVFVEASCGQAYSVDSLEIEQQADGNYAMVVEFSDSYYKEKLQKMSEAALAAGQDRLYLTVGSIRIASMPLTEVITDGKAVFSNLEWYGLDVIEEEHLFVAEFLKECVEGTPMPYMSYYLNYSWAEAEDMSYGLLQKKAGKMEEDMTAAVTAICPGAEVIRGSNYWSIYLNLPLDEALPETSMQMFRDIYENCYIKNGEFGTAFYIYPCNDAMNYYCSFMEDSENYDMRYTGYCTGDPILPYKEEIRKLEEESDFFGTVVQHTAYSEGFVYEYN